LEYLVCYYDCVSEARMTPEKGTYRSMLIVFRCYSSQKDLGLGYKQQKIDGCEAVWVALFA